MQFTNFDSITSNEIITSNEMRYKISSVFGHLISRLSFSCRRFVHGVILMMGNYFPNIHRTTQIENRFPKLM